MHVSSRKQLRLFAAQHPQAMPGLEHWYSAIKIGTFSNLTELRTVFPATDQVGKLFVFNIGGNAVRLIAAIHFNRQKVYIRAILTHTEYDKDKWKE